ncbi:hypothetical protein [Pontibacter chitinilyticus]|uniref:hypothetical protein n=1 Tax=Pontibacter chitinilyticus TaxID=2674989 RepID=UPI00321921F9
MKYKGDYSKVFMALSKRIGAKYLDTSYQAIEEWESLVEQMKNGYHGIQPELEHDLELIREPIETFLVDPNLGQFNDHQEFKGRIEALDTEFIKISIEHPEWKRKNDFRWWSSRILKYGAKKYANFMNAHLDKNLGIVVKTI